MRTFIIIIAIVLVLAIVGYRYGKKALAKFDVQGPNLVGADLSKIFQSGNFATADLSATITNGNNFNIPVSNLYVELYYNGQTLGKSTTPHDKFIIPKNGSVSITQNMTLAAASGLDIASQLLGGNKLTFTYKVTGVLFGFFPFVYRGNFNY